MDKLNIKSLIQIIRKKLDHEYVKDPNITQLTSETCLEAIITKNTVWQYEEEWRIVNAETELDTHRFISAPFIKSVTYGYNIDPICKYMLVDVCKEKNIDLYEIVPSTVDYSLNRKFINKDELNHTI